MFEIKGEKEQLIEVLEEYLFYHSTEEALELLKVVCKEITPASVGKERQWLRLFSRFLFSFFIKEERLEIKLASLQESKKIYSKYHLLYDSEITQTIIPYFKQFYSSLFSNHQTVGLVLDGKYLELLEELSKKLLQFLLDIGCNSHTDSFYLVTDLLFFVLMHHLPTPNESKMTEILERIKEEVFLNVKMLILEKFSSSDEKKFKYLFSNSFKKLLSHPSPKIRILSIDFFSTLRSSSSSHFLYLSNLSTSYFVTQPHSKHPHFDLKPFFNALSFQFSMENNPSVYLFLLQSFLLFLLNKSILDSIPLDSILHSISQNIFSSFEKINQLPLSPFSTSLSLLSSFPPFFFSSSSDSPSSPPPLSTSSTSSPPFSSSPLFSQLYLLSFQVFQLLVSYLPLLSSSSQLIIPNVLFLPFSSLFQSNPLPLSTKFSIFVFSFSNIFFIFNLLLFNRNFV